MSYAAELTTHYASVRRRLYRPAMDERAVAQQAALRSIAESREKARLAELKGKAEKAPAPRRKNSRAIPEWEAKHIAKMLKKKKINDTIMLVALKHNIPAPLIASSSREKAVVWARYEALSILHSSGFSYCMLGRIFRKDHTSVRYGILRFLGLWPTKKPTNPQALVVE